MFNKMLNTALMVYSAENKTERKKVCVNECMRSSV